MNKTKIILFLIALGVSLISLGSALRSHDNAAASYGNELLEMVEVKATATAPARNPFEGQRSVTNESQLCNEQHLSLALVEGDRWVQADKEGWIDVDGERLCAGREGWVYIGDNDKYRSVDCAIEPPTGTTPTWIRDTKEGAGNLEAAYNRHVVVFGCHWEIAPNGEIDLVDYAVWPLGVRMGDHWFGEEFENALLGARAGTTREFGYVGSDGKRHIGRYDIWEVKQMATAPTVAVDDWMVVDGGRYAVIIEGRGNAVSDDHPAWIYGSVKSWINGVDQQSWHEFQHYTGWQDVYGDLLDGLQAGETRLIVRDPQTTSLEVDGTQELVRVYEVYVDEASPLAPSYYVAPEDVGLVPQAAMPVGCIVGPACMEWYDEE